MPYVNPEEFHSDIYNYVFFIKLNQKNAKYPKYILEAGDDIESKKRAFRLKAEKYKLNNDNILFYKEFFKNENNNISSDDETIKQEIYNSEEFEKNDNYK